MVVTNSAFRRCVHCDQKMGFNEMRYAIDMHKILIHADCIRPYFNQTETEREDKRLSIEKWGGYFNEKTGKWIEMITDSIPSAHGSEDFSANASSYNGIIKGDACNMRQKDIPWDDESNDTNPDGTTEWHSSQGENSSWGDPKPLG